MERYTLASAGLVVLLASTSAALAAKSPQDFIGDAIRGDTSEIMLGQLAEQKGGTQQVRNFGSTLVADHTKAKQQATDVAKTLNVTPPTDAMKEAQDENTKLSKMSGADFDREFQTYMIQDHRKDIAEYQSEAQDDHGPAGTLASEQLPVLQKHLQIAQSLQSSENGGAAAKAPPITGFIDQETPDMWSASKLVGVPIYGPQNSKVGDINDVLMDHDGKVVGVVIGIGGFLGIGQKNVGVPFSDVKFTDQPMPPANGTTAPAGAPTGANGAGTAAPSSPVGLGTPPSAPGTMNAPGAPSATATRTPNAPGTMNAPVANGGRPRSSAYPDHGVISETADQLKAAQNFQYAK